LKIKTKPAKDKIEGIPPQFSSFEIYRVKRRGGGAVKTVMIIGGKSTMVVKTTCLPFISKVTSWQS